MTRLIVCLSVSATLLASFASSASASRPNPIREYGKQQIVRPNPITEYGVSRSYRAV